MQGETMLRVANIGSEAAMESIRDALDRLGVDYEHVRSEPNETYYPQTAYFYVPDDSADDVDNIMQELSEEYGFDAEVL
jgi:signal recognition particle subunit SEC65